MAGQKLAHNSHAKKKSVVSNVGLSHTDEVMATSDKSYWHSG